jgi:hypothetical protein
LYLSLTHIAVTGKPLPKPLPSVVMSGTVFQCSIANILPVRPMQVSTSSAMSRQPSLSQSFLSFGINSSGGTTEPPQPWIGSNTMPASCPDSSFLIIISR